MTALSRTTRHGVFRAFTIVLASSAAAMGGARGAAAHDYWMLPDPLVLPPAAERDVALALFVGDDFVAEDEKRFERARASRFVHVTRDGATDVLGQAAEGQAPILRVSLGAGGGHLFALDRNAARIELPAERFEQYLEHEGLSAVVVERAKRGESALAGRERYTRHLKALVQVGAARDAVFGAVLGQELEIVPEADPVHVEPGASVSVRVLFRGSPLDGARLEAMSHGAEGVRISAFATDHRGAARVPVERRGVHLLRLVHMVRCAGCEDADWQSFWASYVFATAAPDGSAVVAPPMRQSFRRASWTDRGLVRGIAAVLALSGLAAVVLLLRWSRRPRRPRDAAGRHGDG